MEKKKTRGNKSRQNTILRVEARGYWQADRCEEQQGRQKLWYFKTCRVYFVDRIGGDVNQIIKFGLL